jgi:hypothetical protein
MSELEKQLMDAHRKHTRASTVASTSLYEKAADRIEAQAEEIEAYRRSLYLKQALISDQAAEIERLRAAVKDIQIEAEREKGNWTHLKQVIARKAHAALAGKAEQ